MGLAVAGTFDKNTGKYYFEINNTDGDIPVTLHPIIRDRIENMPSSVRDGYKFTYGAGSRRGILLESGITCESQRTANRFYYPRRKIW